jgi:hypothetical protein
MEETPGRSDSAFLSTLWKGINTMAVEKPNRSSQIAFNIKNQDKWKVKTDISGIEHVTLVLTLNPGSPHLYTPGKVYLNAISLEKLKELRDEIDRHLRYAGPKAEKLRQEDAEAQARWAVERGEDVAEQENIPQPESKSDLPVSDLKDDLSPEDIPPGSKIVMEIRERKKIGGN